MSLLYKFIALNAADRRTLLQAGLVLPVVSLSLRFFGFHRTRALISSLVPEFPSGSLSKCAVQIAYAQGLSRLIDVAARRGISDVNCLQRSLALWWLLELRGIKSDLRFGARKLHGTFQAHAWVEIDGMIINDVPDVREQFAPFEKSYSLEAFNFE